MAWAAGLFEGEGSVSRKTARLQVKMISEQSVRRFGEVMDVGKVYGPYGPYPSQMGKTPFFVWVAWHQEDVRSAAAALIPYVSPWMRAKLEAACAL